MGAAVRQRERQQQHQTADERGPHHCNEYVSPKVSRSYFRRIAQSGFKVKSMAPKMGVIRAASLGFGFAKDHDCVADDGDAKIASFVLHAFDPTEGPERAAGWIMR